MEESNYTLCPRGYGTASFRMYEALQVGSIPVYVWAEELWLPFKERISWKDIAIIVNGADVDSLADLINASDTVKMQSNIAKLRHMFTYEYSLRYVLEKVTEMDV